MVHPDDDMAHNVMRAQQRDAGVPSKEEAKKMHRDYLAREGCARCDECDPDNLDRYGILQPSCSGVQSPPEPDVVLCDDCEEERPDSFVEGRLEEERERGEADVAVVYECGLVGVHEREVPTQTSPDGEEIPVPYANANASVLMWCERCGATVDRVVYLDEEGGS